MVILDMTKGLNHIGRLGENEHRAFRFPDSCEVLAMYPGVYVSVLVKRPGDAESYPVAPGYVEIRDGAVYWTVQSGDLIRVGRGKVELSFIQGTTVAKNFIYDIYVDNALDGSGEAPEPWESWRTNIARTAAEIAADRQAAETAATGAETAKTGAETAQSSAETAARNAATGATAAGDAATAAARSAEQTNQSAGTAVRAAETAGQAATAAGQSATTAGTKATEAAGSATAAGASALVAEGYANGTQGGVPVGSDSSYYGNNAKEYARQAAASAKAAEDTVNGAVEGITQAGTTQVGNVNTAGSTQVQAVEDKGQEVLDSIPADYTELSGDVSDLKSAISDNLLDTITNSVNMTYSSYVEYKQISSDGSITDSSLQAHKIYVYTVASQAETIVFNAVARLNGEGKCAFYSSENYAGCSSSTLIGSRIDYTNTEDKTVSVPSGAKIFLIGARQEPSKAKYNYNTYVSKADANLATAYSPAKIYYTGEYCVNDGKVYLRKIYTGVAEPSFDSTKWEETKALTEVKKINDKNEDYQYFDSSLFQIGSINSYGEIITNQKYKIVNTNLIHITETTTVVLASGYSLTIYYYDSNGDYLDNNGSLTDYQHLTILADSYVRIQIRIAGSSTTLTNEKIPALVHAVSFKTEYKKTMETISENSEGTMKALSAKMFQKGGSPVSLTKSPCILVAGQSNINGRVPNADLPSSITPPFSNLYINENSTSGTFTNPLPLPNSKWGIDFSLYSELNKLGSTWYVIKKSMGGTSISPYGDSTYHWTPFYEELDDISKSLLHVFHQQINACDHSLFDFRALIWQQGEGDRASTSKKAALDYYKNFRCLVSYIRGITGNEKLPVVCGTVSHNSGQYDPTVEAATLRLAAEDPYMICIDMSEATLLDAYHFDADSAVYFGYKAYDALIDLGVVTGTKINPTPPWEEDDD